MSGERMDKWFDHLVYLRVFEGCDLHCKHCFIPSNPKRMSLDQVASVPSMLRARVKPGSNILLQFHGGEPTLMGHEWIRKSIEVLLKEGSEFNWKFSIQTNLMSFNEEWAALYLEYFPDGLGVSWDEKIRLTHKGQMDSWERFEHVFWPNMSDLIKYGLTPRLVITVTKKLIDEYRVPYRLLSRLMERGIHDIHFEKLTKTGMARLHWDEIGVNNLEYSQWMDKLISNYLMLKQDTEIRLNVSPVDGLFDTVQALLNGSAAGGSGCWSNVCDTRFHTIDANGYKSGCTALTSESDNKASQRMEGVHVVRIEDIIGMRNHRVKENKCDTCDYKPICSSGCLASDINDGSGECSGHSLLFARAEKEKKENWKGFSFK